MKRILFVLMVISSLLSLNHLKAQSIQIHDENGNNLIGDTIVYSHIVDPNNQFQYYEHKGFADIINNTSSSMTIGLIRHEEKIVANTYDYLCWGSQCFGEKQAGSMPFWDVNDSAVVSASDTASGLLGGLVIYHRPNTNPGESIYRYEFYDRANRSTSSSIYVKLNTSLSTSLIEKNVEKNSFKIFPNPVEDLAVISFDKSIQLEESQISIYNIVGKKISTFSLSAKKLQQQLDVSAFVPGVYFVVLENSGERVATKRLIKK